MCPECLQLNAYIDDELDQQQCHNLEQHCLSCRQCREHLQQLQQVEKLLEQSCITPETSAVLQLEKFHQKLYFQRQRRLCRPSFREILQAIFPITAAAAIFVSGMFLFNNSSKTDTLNKPQVQALATVVHVPPPLQLQGYQQRLASTKSRFELTLPGSMPLPVYTLSTALRDEAPALR